jgi:hypothetical protein
MMKRMAIYKRVERAISSGDLLKAENCEICGNRSKLYAHHEDYNQPLKVLWVCCSCHKNLHKNSPRKKYKSNRTVGNHCLQKYLTKHDQNIKEFCNEANIAPPVIYRYLSGERRLSARTMAKIVKVTGGKVTYEDLIAEMKS